jgi:hypothetical protein
MQDGNTDLTKKYTTRRMIAKGETTRVHEESKEDI